MGPRAARRSQARTAARGVIKLWEPTTSATAALRRWVDTGQGLTDAVRTINEMDGWLEFCSARAYARTACRLACRAASETDAARVETLVRQAVEAGQQALDATRLEKSRRRIERRRQGADIRLTEAESASLYRDDGVREAAALRNLQRWAK